MNLRMSLAIAVGAASGCMGSDHYPAVVRTDSAGVELVVTSGTDRALPWRLDRVFALGGAEDGPESFYSVGIHNVAADQTGRIFVLDRTRVVVFSRDGVLLRVLGKAGKGPGEITGGASLAVSPSGGANVFDYGKGALVRFDSVGTIQSELAFRVFPQSAASRHIAVRDDGILAAGMIPSMQEGIFRQALQFMTQTDTTILAEVFSPRPEMVMYASCGGGLNLPRIFEPEVLWAASRDYVAVASGVHYSVDLRRDGDVVRRIRRDLPVLTATAADAITELGEGFRINFGRGPCLIPAAEMASRRGYAPVIPWIRQVTLTPTGELWVLRREAGDLGSERIDVLDASGAYIGSPPLGTPFPIVFLDDSRYVTAETDEMDVARLVAYDVVRH